MYCTGGVRCERASALLKSKYGDTVSGVYQLQVLICSAGAVARCAAYHSGHGQELWCRSLCKRMRFVQLEAYGLCILVGRDAMVT